jgi:mannosyltransferase
MTRTSTSTVIDPAPSPSAHAAHRTGGRAARSAALAPVLVGLLGLGVSLIGITVPSVWYDEAATISSATRSWPDLWRMVGTVDAVHAGFYAIMHLVFDLFGYSPFTLRAPSAVAVGATAALTVVLGRQLGTARFGVIAGLAFCLLPRVSWMGAEGRSFAFSALLAVAVTVVLVHALRSPARRWWVLYSALVVLSCLVFVYLAFVVVAHGVTVLWLLASKRGHRARMTRRWLLATATAGGLSTPFALEVVSQSEQVAWIAPIGRRTLRHVFENQWFYESEWFAILAWALIAVGAVVLVLRRDDGAAVLLPAFAVPTLALLAVTEYYSPVYSPRYLAMGLPFVALVMAAAIDRITARVGPPVALVVLAALLVPQLQLQRAPESKDSAAWDRVAALMRAERDDDAPGTTTAVIFGTVQRHPFTSTKVVQTSYPDDFGPVVDVTLRETGASAGTLWETRYPLDDPAALDRIDTADVVYLVTGKKRDRRPATIETMTSEGWHVAEEWSLTRMRVLRFERDAPAS